MIYINNKLNEIFDILNDSSLIREIKVLKKDIYSDKELKDNLNNLNNLNNNYNSYLIETKRKILDNPKVIRFRILEQELNSLIYEINKRLNSLTIGKSCFYENN